MSSRSPSSSITSPADLPSAPIYTNAGAKPRNINGLVFNIFFPGIGSLVCGRLTGLLMILLFLGGVVVCFLPIGLHKFWGVAMMIAAWIWSIVAGIYLLDQKESSTSNAPST